VTFCSATMLCFFRRPMPVLCAIERDNDHLRAPLYCPGMSGDQVVISHRDGAGIEK
jgi:hypothetical protein